MKQTFKSIKFLVNVGFERVDVGLERVDGSMERGDVGLDCEELGMSKARVLQRQSVCKKVIFGLVMPAHQLGVQTRMGSKNCLTR